MRWAQADGEAGTAVTTPVAAPANATEETVPVVQVTASEDAAAGDAVEVQSRPPYCLKLYHRPCVAVGCHVCHLPAMTKVSSAPSS